MTHVSLQNVTVTLGYFNFWKGVQLKQGGPLAVTTHSLAGLVEVRWLVRPDHLRRGTTCGVTDHKASPSHRAWTSEARPNFHIEPQWSGVRYKYSQNDNHVEFDGLINELFVPKSNQQGTQVWTMYTVFEKQRFTLSKLVASNISKMYSELSIYIATCNGWCIYQSK